VTAVKGATRAPPSAALLAPRQDERP
jgi:hypothetical protein